MTQGELAKTYEPAAVEAATMQRWLTEKAFAAHPDAREHRYVVMMPLPNVTGALHMGHAMDNVMQDLLIRWHRMQGENTLWMAGTDHAGIATQAVVEKRLKELEGKTRHDVGRDGLVQRIWAWKEQCQTRIVKQQQAMGCSCDWDRTRFTMDAVCARAVRHVFFRMFADGLIYQGLRLVNWDCALQTAVADDELYKASVQGHFWYLRYPVIDPRPGEPTHVTVATTRPETLLGDTAVAVHPDPRAAVADRAIDPAHLAHLEQVAALARAGRKVMLPLAKRPIPIVLDAWADPTLGSGCVKVTPAHDPNDYQVWLRHRQEIAILRVLNDDGTLNDKAGEFAGLDRFVARERIVAALQHEGLVARVEDRAIEIDHSDRSKTIVEPLLSKQWFVRMGDVEGGIVLGRGTANERPGRGLAQAAIDAAGAAWRSPTGRHVEFHPDGERYAKIYLAWLQEKRDWCISRQLWWGHRIPVWNGRFAKDAFLGLEGILAANQGRPDLAAFAILPDGTRVTPHEALELMRGADAPATVDVQICFRDEHLEQQLAPMLQMAGLTADPDVLDTWFSSAIWPFSTLGWPDPASARVDKGQPQLGADGDAPDCLAYYYPGSCLVTGRDILTLWVARMVVLGMYALGDVPFTDVFLHANIQDGKGERMSKSKGNGIDPVDIIERYGADAMRYVICEMQTGTQDIRLPVQAISPYTGELIDLTTAKHGRTIFTYLDPKSGKEFDVLGTMPDVPAAKLVSERFEVGRAFCNKLWNAARFALMNLQEVRFTPLHAQDLALEDRWILSRLEAARATAHGQLTAYTPSAAIGALREFFWSDLCDWYLELVKPRMKDPARAGVAQQVLAFVLDQVLRLFHPFVPFITEALWQKLCEQAPQRGIAATLAPAPLLVGAAWPEPIAAARDPQLEERIAFLQLCVTAIREVRARYVVPPSARLPLRIRATGASAEALTPTRQLLAHMAGAAEVVIAANPDKPRDAATAVVKDLEIHVCGVVDAEKEKRKLAKQLEQLQARIDTSAKKLANEGFLAKAGEAVVQKERAQLAELRAQLASVEQGLRDLG